jgi:hypothetical protein
MTTAEFCKEILLNHIKNEYYINNFGCHPNYPNQLTKFYLTKIKNGIMIDKFLTKIDINEYFPNENNFVEENLISNFLDEFEKFSKQELVQYTINRNIDILKQLCLFNYTFFLTETIYFFLQSSKIAKRTYTIFNGSSII